MKEFEFRDIDESYAEARENIELATQDKNYIDYAMGSGPLRLANLSKDKLQDPAVQACMARDGWPNLTDSLVEPVYDFPDETGFIDSLRSEDEHGAEHLSSSRFIRLIGSPVIDRWQQAKSAEDLNGLEPVVHRAHAVAPELFDNLQVVVAKLFDRYRIVADEDFLYEEIMRPENTHIQEALYMAYRIMGRLVKVDDMEWTSRSFETRRDELPTPILNADEFLRHGY